VITIIGILASLITVAAVGALKAANQNRIKIDANQISGGFEEYKNKTTAYPPNCQTDDTNYAAGAEPTTTPLSESQVLSDLKRHLKQVAPKHREPEELLLKLTGLFSGNEPQLTGGMSAGEAVVFWLGGFSSDPKYPISGEGGPSYQVRPNAPAAMRRTLDPISNRKWVFPFEVTRLGPRADDEYFDESDGRYIEYTVNTGSGPQTRRINFWQYAPPKSTQPYLYFDTSRHPPTAAFDPPAATATEPNGLKLHVHALKKRSDSSDSTVPIQFVDPDKFQVLHCGIDDAWDTTDFTNFERMSAHGVEESGGDPKLADDYLLFPTGPFIGEIADTVVNFATQSKIEDAAQ
jgi:type II secretory pathway pseudopilin PulG